MSLKFPYPFVGGIKSKDVTLSLSGEGYSLKVGSLLFGSPESDSAVNKPIFEINTTEYKTNISTPMLFGSGKNTLSLGSMAASASPKICGSGFGL